MMRTAEVMREQHDEQKTPGTPFPAQQKRETMTEANNHETRAALEIERDTEKTFDHPTEAPRLIKQDCLAALEKYDHPAYLVWSQWILEGKARIVTAPRVPAGSIDFGIMVAAVLDELSATTGELTKAEREDVDRALEHYKGNVARRIRRVFDAADAAARTQPPSFSEVVNPLILKDKNVQACIRSVVDDILNDIEVADPVKYARLMEAVRKRGNDGP